MVFYNKEKKKLNSEAESREVGASDWGRGGLEEIRRG